MEKKNKKPKHYINNTDFYLELKKYYKDKKDNPNVRLSNYIGQCILQMSEKIASRPNFSNYTYKDEMISDGIEAAVNAAKSFNPEKSNNPFGYFSKVIWNAFLRRIAFEKRENETKHKNYQRLYNDGIVIENKTSESILDQYNIDKAK